jgi:gluconate 2-dehydrogenase gamma chain
MPGHDLARRALLRSSLLLVPGVQEALGQAAQHGHPAAQAGAPKLTYLTPGDAAELESLAAEIIPTDDAPGAREAGVIFFIDRALASFDKDKRQLYRTGLANAQTRRRALFPASASLAALKPAQRITLLEAIEKTEFFEALRVHTITGFFADPAWGGNRDKAGWHLIGFEDRWMWKPPFGYYDAPENMSAESPK